MTSKARTTRLRDRDRRSRPTDAPREPTPDDRRAADMLTLLQSHILGDLEASVRWFYAQMPQTYFQLVTVGEQALHLEMIHMARRASEPRLTVVDDHSTGKLLVIGRPDLHALLDVLPLIETRGIETKGFSERLIHRVELHTSHDRSLFLYAFCYGKDDLPAVIDLDRHRKEIQTAIRAIPGGDRFLSQSEPGYLVRSTVERVVRHVRAWSGLPSDDDVAILVDLDRSVTPATRVLLAVTGQTPWQILAHTARVIHRHRLSLVRGYLDFVPAVAAGERAIISTVYLATGEKPLPARLADAVASDLRQVHRQYPDALTARYLDGTYALEQLELLRAALGFAMYLLAADYPYLDVDEVGQEVLAAHADLCRELTALVAARFSPARQAAPTAWQRRYRTLSTQAHALEPRTHAAVLEGMLQFVAGMRLTNAFCPQRLGLSFKIDPAILPAAKFTQRPFGVFFFLGPQARGFHIRFRASARGGLRVLIPRNPGQYERSKEGVLKEVYDLAWAQQLKNKDIPEGGSKCIALVEPGGSADGAVRQLGDSLLDLILPAESSPMVIAPHGAAREADLIFLGPDENMTPERIAWVAARAKSRGLPHHPTLMSSKPGSGINHKEFGVTSEGIFRWISLILPIVGVAEGQPYTVKITGGPDGDVGGNLLKVLKREHGARARVLAIADGTGSAYDPKGLDWRELMRLVDASLGIARFDPARLSSTGAAGGKVVAATDKAGEALRNSLHNTVVADLFVPCGGRPYTINDENWSKFLGADGKPTAKAMVEGANIFLTPTARRHLEDAGLVVIKDSSANKGGVICSSYEVLAGLVLSDEEFLAIKPQYVADVLQLIRERATDESRALISAWQRRGHSVRLSDLSQQVSEEINRVSGLIEPTIAAHLDDPAMTATWERHLEAHCPPVLVARYRARLRQRIPPAHRVAILSKRLSSRMVYKEGLTWCRSYLTDNRQWDTLSTYLTAESQVRAVCERLDELDLPGGSELIKVIAAGAQRELVRRKLGQEF